MLADALEGAAEPVGVRRVAECVAALEPVRLGQPPLVEVVQLVRPGVVRRPGDVQQPLGHALRVVVQPAERGHEIGTPPVNPVVELGGAAHGGQYVDASVERSRVGWMMIAMTMSRVERWERRTEVPLLLLATAFLVAYVWPVLDPDMSRGAKEFLDTVSWTVWGAFAIDFAIRIALAERRRSYIVRHWYDVLLVVIPLLRPIRLLRLLAFARIVNRTAAGSLAGRATTYVIAIAVMSVGLGAVAVLDVERDAPARTSPRSRTRCGGRPRRSRPSATATGSR